MSSNPTAIGRDQCYSCNGDASRSWICESDACSNRQQDPENPQRSKFYLCEACTFACPFCGTPADEQHMQPNSDVSSRRDSLSTTSFAELKEEVRGVWREIENVKENMKKTSEVQQKVNEDQRKFNRSLTEFTIHHAIGGKPGGSVQPLSDDEKITAIIIGKLSENLPSVVELRNLVKACDKPKNIVNRLLHDLQRQGVTKRTNPDEGNPKWTLANG